jgi:hypothetical protein
MRKERPMLFSTDMVKAILEGRKSQTRRVLENQSDGNVIEFGHEWELKELLARCPKGKPGDLIWVKETFQYCMIDDDEDSHEKILYRANPEDQDILNQFEDPIWRASMFMPKSASRIWLEITDVRIEQLQDITNEDAKAEGVKRVIDKVTGWCGYDYLSDSYNLLTLPVDSFFSLWKKIHKMDRYDKLPNPWVWVISFKVLSTTGRPQIAKLLEVNEGDKFRFLYDPEDRVRTANQVGKTEIYCPHNGSNPYDENEVYLRSDREVIIISKQSVSTDQPNSKEVANA